MPAKKSDQTIDIALNKTGSLVLEQKMSASDIDDLVKDLPDKVKVYIPFWGTVVTPVDCRENVRSLLKDKLPHPSLKATFKVRGKCADFSGITIENSKNKLLGLHEGSAQVANVGFSFNLYAEVDEDGDYTTIDCKCSNGAKGKAKRRTFHVDWYIDITVNPGLGGTYPVDEYDIVVTQTPCCPGAVDDDEDDDGGGLAPEPDKPKAPKNPKKGDKPPR